MLFHSQKLMQIILTTTAESVAFICLCRFETSGAICDSYVLSDVALRTGLTGVAEAGVYMPKARTWERAANQRDLWLLLLDGCWRWLCLFFSLDMCWCPNY